MNGKFYSPGFGTARNEKVMRTSIVVQIIGKFICGRRYIIYVGCLLSSSAVSLSSAVVDYKPLRMILN
jgi:hypothetical protein